MIEVLLLFFFRGGLPATPPTAAETTKNEQNNQRCSLGVFHSPRLRFIRLRTGIMTSIKPQHGHRDGASLSLPLVALFEQLPAVLQFALLVLGVFVFFGIHNFLQEAIMQITEKKFGVMLGYTEVLGVVIFSYLERTCVVKEKGRVAPLSYYPLLTGCLLGSSGRPLLARSNVV